MHLSARSIPILERAFNNELENGSTRRAAETAYAIAVHYRNLDVGGLRDWEKAKKWAQRCVSLLDNLPSDTLEQTVSTRTSVAEVPLPEIFHCDVAKSRLADLLV